MDTVRSDGLFCLKLMRDARAMKAMSVKPEGIGIWHCRLGHIGEENLRKLKPIVEGMKLNSSSLGLCESCIAGKQTKQNSTTPGKRAGRPLELIHSDLCGRVQPQSAEGVNYVGFVIDDSTRMTSAIGLKGKSARELFERFKEYREQVQVELGRQISRLRTDGGGEYQKEFGRYLKSVGIIYEITALYSLEQNGVSERNNRTVMERVRAILHETNLPKELWMELVSTVVYLKNRSPTIAVKGKTPFEA